MGSLLFMAFIFLVYAMVHEYKVYLEDNYEAKFGIWDFIKRERFYIFLFLGLAYIFVQAIALYLFATRE